MENPNSEWKAKKNSRSPLSTDSLITIEELSAFTTLSVRLLCSLIGDRDFPRFKFEKRVVFDKRTVIDILSKKFVNFR